MKMKKKNIPKKRNTTDKKKNTKQESTQDNNRNQGTSSSALDEIIASAMFNGAGISGWNPLSSDNDNRESPWI